MSTTRDTCEVLPAGTATDAGAVATVVALLLGTGVLFGAAALSIDVGQLYAERGQLQNGADATALAIAVDCAAATASCDTAAGGQARTMANGNANDGTSSVLAVCGAGSSRLAGCGGQSGPAPSCRSTTSGQPTTMPSAPCSPSSAATPPGPRPSTSGAA